MTNEDKIQMYISACRICTLSSKMRDCTSCRFNVGLIVKGLRLAAAAEEGLKPTITAQAIRENLYHVKMEVPK